MVSQGDKYCEYLGKCNCTKQETVYLYNTRSLKLEIYVKTKKSDCTSVHRMSCRTIPDKSMTRKLQHNQSGYELLLKTKMTTLLIHLPRVLKSRMMIFVFQVRWMMHLFINWIFSYLVRFLKSFDGAARVLGCFCMPKF